MDHSILHSQPHEAHKAGFTVMIVACGPIRGAGGIVCAVTVTQPVQSWTVIRSHDEFRAMAQALAPLTPTLPACPAPLGEQPEVSAVVNARNELQEWLTGVLMYAGAREVPAVRNFLILGANMIPPQYEGVSWTQFSPIVVPPQPPPVSLGYSTAPPAVSNTNLDDMDMDDMFIAGDEGSVPHDDHDHEEDEDYIPSASVRYKPTDEAVTEADEMEIMDLAGEVEMVEDIGSLAQSLGASHLGRSLQLQTEMKRQGNTPSSRPVQGLKIGGASNGAPVAGGIGGAMARAQAIESNTNTAFHSKPMQSAPKLDSFKLIKVIGKGSFGKCFWVILVEASMYICFIAHGKTCFFYS